MRRLLFLSGLTCAVLLAAAAAEDVSLEYRVKAAYLYNFVKFVEWPDDARQGAIDICVAGHNPFGDVLNETIRGEIVRGRPLAARVILEPDTMCEVVFVPTGAATSAYLRAARGMPILTVGEADDFLEQGGIVALVNDGRNIRFAISTEAAAAARLQISSRLLRLALNTRVTR